MEFRTELLPTPFPFQINHQNCLLSIGSCFAEHFSVWLKEWGFSYHSNPFGIVFNPVSIAEQLEFLAGKRQWAENDVFYNGNYYSSYSVHSSCYANSLSDTLLSLHEKTVQPFFTKADVVIITLGTAWVYEEKLTGKVVANCHKMPSSHFIKRLLSQQEINDALASICELLDGKKIIFTLSPVRHLKDGLIENNRGKARLLEAIHQCCESKNNTYYFPSYELVVDDLRDYRFYSDDLLHPSVVAVAYVKEKFVLTAFNNETRNILKETEEMNRLMSHRILQKGSPSEDLFQKKRTERLREFKEKYPFVLLPEINK